MDSTTPSFRALFLQTFFMVFLLSFCLLTEGFAQLSDSRTDSGVYVDEKGVLRWEQDKEEIQGFGVNYTVPFAHAHRSAKRLGVDPLQAIDQDVYHFARLGFDLFRVHVWDTEISDTLGNVLYNKHLHAFDYLLYKLSERDIKYVLTPIAFWGNGWPEPDSYSPGFSAKYGKGACLTHPEAIKAQERYLVQFLEHVNPYTQIAYKDDPHLIAVEVSNEPHHREAPEKVTAFVQRMVEAMRSTGYAKPIFYNISHSVHLAEAYFKADIQGGTFQWYPTGLGYQQELPGNFLPHVDRYPIPFEAEIKAAKGAKLVYEFDAADVGRSYIYPAMARSFRQAGIQIATHFSYDPTYLAYANTEYNTHYMNLAYTPGKALSLMIAGEVFHHIPMYQDFGRYPDNTTFGDFSVSYEEDLATFNNGKKYYHTNHTHTQPKNQSQLQHITGRGNSPLVRYEGTGAYFLDQLESGQWRLEVMPDVLTVGNPYGRNSLEKKVAEIAWNTRSMQVNLDDLGKDFALTPLNPGNDFHPAVNGQSFSIRPGVYLVSRKGQEPLKASEIDMERLEVTEFAAPAQSLKKTYLLHEVPSLAVAGEALKVVAQVASPHPETRVELWVGEGFPNHKIDMRYQSGFSYEATIPAEQIKSGFLTYYILVYSEKEVRTFPSGHPGLPYAWDNYQREPYRVRVSGAAHPIYLFQAQHDQEGLSWTRWVSKMSLQPLAHPAESALHIQLDSLFVRDAENLQGPEINDYSIRQPLGPKLDHLRSSLDKKEYLVVKAHALQDRVAYLQVALVNAQGQAFGKVLQLDAEMTTYRIPIAELVPVKTVNLPRPYPSFLPYYFESTPDPEAEKPGVDLATIEALQFSIGPGIPLQEIKVNQGISIVSVHLE
ncbi:MAG: membrane or secreted protein [Bacteroidota bacterium]